MIKKLVLLLGLCLGASLRGMIQEKQSIQSNEVVTILCEGKALTLDKRLALLSEVLKNGFEDAGCTNGLLVLPSVISLPTWAVTQALLEKVSHCEDAQEDASRVYEEIFDGLKALDAPTLIKLLVAVDCLDIPCLSSSVLHAASEIDVLALSVEELEMVPLHLRGLIVMYQAVNHLGPLPGKVIATYVEQEGDVFLKESCCLDAITTPLAYRIDEQGTLRLYERGPLSLESMIVQSKEEIIASLSSCKLLAVCPNHKDRKYFHMKGPDNGTYFSSSPDGAFSMWDREGNDLVVFRGHTGRINSICRMRDGKIASASDDTTVRVWNSRTGEPLFIGKGHTFKVSEVCMLPNGNLVSVSADSTMRVWDSATGKRLAICGEVAPSGFGVSVSVTADGNPVSQGLVSSPGLLSFAGSHFSSTKKITCVWDVSLVDRLRNAQEDHMQKVWLYLQDVVRRKKVGTFNTNEGWDTLAGILDEADAGILSRMYRNARNGLYWSLGWTEHSDK